MQISKEDVEELRRIWKEEFNEEISYAEVLEIGLRLIGLFKIVYRALPKDKQTIKS